MSKSHVNKKRNSGLMFEFLVRTISSALVDGDKKKSALALRIIKRHFKPGSQLHKEYRLINSLMQTTVSSETVAGSILQEAKNAARGYDLAQLDREKSLLISNVNRSLGANDFYDQQVNNYRMYSTVQTLINDWRDPNRDLGRLAQYEDALVKWLVSEKPVENEGILSEDGPGTSRLLMKIMMRKLNEKYAGMLSNEQRQLIRAYAFSTVNDDTQTIKTKLTEIRERLLNEIAEFQRQNDSIGELVDGKLKETQLLLQDEVLGNVDDGTVARFMLYTKLSAELTSEAT